MQNRHEPLEDSEITAVFRALKAAGNDKAVNVAVQLREYARLYVLEKYLMSERNKSLAERLREAAAALEAEY